MCIDGELNFSEFLFMIVSYVFFDKKQILQCKLSAK